MKKYQVSINIFIEAISSFEAVNEFEKMAEKKIIPLRKYQVVELTTPKVVPFDNNNNNEQQNND